MRPHFSTNEISGCNHDEKVDVDVQKAILSSSSLKVFACLGSKYWRNLKKKGEWKKDVIFLLSRMFLVCLEARCCIVVLGFYRRSLPVHTFGGNRTKVDWFIQPRKESTNLLRFQKSKFALSVTRTEPDLNASRRLEEAATAVRLTGGGGQGKEGWANFEELVLGCVGTDLII